MAVSYRSAPWAGSATSSSAADDELAPAVSARGGCSSSTELPDRRPWPPDARAPPAKNPPASRPPPRHPHLARDMHQVPFNARATLRPPPPQLYSLIARSRGEELPATSLSSAGKPAGRPCLLLACRPMPERRRPRTRRRRDHLHATPISSENQQGDPA